MTDSSSLNYVYTKECPWPWFFSWPSWPLMSTHPNTFSWASAEPLAAAIGFLRQTRPRDGMWMSQNWKWNIAGQETMSEASQGCCKLPELLISSQLGQYFQNYGLSESLGILPLTPSEFSELFQSSQEMKQGWGRAFKKKTLKSFINKTFLWLNPWPYIYAALEFPGKQATLSQSLLFHHWNGTWRPKCNRCYLLRSSSPDCKLKDNNAIQKKKRKLKNPVLLYLDFNAWGSRFIY